MTKENLNRILLVASLLMAFVFSCYLIIAGTYKLGYKNGYECGAIDATKNFDDLQVNRIIQMDEVWKYVKDKENKNSVSSGN